MPRLLLALAALVLTAWLAGCATLTKSQCEAGDWRAIGVNDGYHGYAQTRYDEHVDACAKFSITPNRQLYLAGYADGLKSYCRLERAADEGTSGDVYRNVCTGEIGISFNRVYMQARDVYEARKAADDTGYTIDEVTNKLAAEGLDKDVRQALRSQLWSLQFTLDREQNAIAREERELRTVLAEELRRLNALGIET